MSEENVETTHRFTEAFVSGDYEAAAAELGPNVEIDDTDIPESTGADSFYAWLARWESWESWRIEDLEIRPVGEDRTISLFKMVVRGKGSDIELTRDDAALAELRDGKIVRIGYYKKQHPIRKRLAACSTPSAIRRRGCGPTTGTRRPARAGWSSTPTTLSLSAADGFASCNRRDG
jgi:hypothetical protein